MFELGTLLAAALPACAGSLRQLELRLDGTSDQTFHMGLWPTMLGSQLRRLVSSGRGKGAGVLGDGRFADAATTCGGRLLCYWRRNRAGQVCALCCAHVY